MLSPKDKLQKLLGELFQFDCADLDFGIYRIMNFKREAIEKFIQKDLIKAVDMELNTGVVAGQTKIAEELENIAKQIHQAFGENALDSNGVLVDAFQITPLGKQYLDLKSQATGTQTKAALETDIYNHLYAFFSRYYDSGDFLSKRRYSRKEKYAIPYNGEEVYLHWANSDQYYIKTGEYFNNYQYKTAFGITVHFKLVAADVEKDNVKGDKRFFILVIENITYNTETKEVLIPLQYRPLTEQESIKYGQRNQQDVIISEALETIPAKLKEYSDTIAALQNAWNPDKLNKGGKPVSLLEHHLTLYTQRNTSDFFIHKDLKGFLTRELDFYLKNEVLNIDELGVAGQARTEGWFQVMNVVKAIGGRIIEFLAQIENFQKKLFEKKKFITETQYCITMSTIPEMFYPEIANCEAQWQEWKELFHIDEEQIDLFTAALSNTTDRRIAFIKSHSTLVLDTKHFSRDFNDRLLASFNDLDEMTDGLLIHSENFQALNLLQKKYRESVSCVHIDPPYNTQTSGFLYKNDYQHSSWLSMMENRIKAGISLMSLDGSYLCHIDENEYERLQLLFDHFPLQNAGTIAWDKRNPMNAGQGIATQHEYIIWRSNKEAPIYLRNDNILSMLKTAAEIVNKYVGVSEKAQKEYATWVNNNAELSEGEKAYRYLDEKGRIYRSVSLRAPEPRTDPKFHKPLIHPITGKPCSVPPNGFSRTPETLSAMIARGEIIFGDDETTQPNQKMLLTEESKRQVSSVIQDGRKGKADLDRLGLNFPYCHPVSLYEQLIGAAIKYSNDRDIVIDYFAGSATTGHAVININREYRENHRFVLVEMENYFDTVIIPRIKKVIFTPEWKDGKPVRQATALQAQRSPNIVKYIRLESYEDALNNITFKEAPKTLYDFDDYLLKYMLDWETKESDTFLNISKLASPFSYKLNIIVNQEKQEKVIDIPETFSYLLGLNVKTRRVFNDDGRCYLVYRGSVDHREIAVIWRDTAGWEEKDYTQDKDFVAFNKLADGADEVLVNGDSLIPNAHSLDGTFKSRMFGEL